MTVDNKTRQPRRATGLVIVLLLAACNPAAHDDTATIQGDIDRGTPLPAGTYTVGPLHDSPDVTITGAGRTATVLRARDPGETILTLTGTHKAGGTVVELQSGPVIAGIGFEGQGGTGITYSGLAYFALRDASFSGFTVAVDQQGSLQSEVADVVFRDNATALRYAAAQIAYMAGPVPPNRVMVSWCSFYANTVHAIDYSGGAQLVVADSEFGGNGTAGDDTTSAIRFGPDPYNNPPAQGLVMRGGWLEGNKGLAAIVIEAQPVAHEHTISEVFVPTNDARYLMAVDGQNTVTMDRDSVAAKDAISATGGAVVR